MFCTNCGKEVKDNSYKFCIYCGAKLIEIGANPIKQEEPTNIITKEEVIPTTDNNDNYANDDIKDNSAYNNVTVDNGNNNNKGTNKTIIVVAIVVVAIAIVAALFFINKDVILSKFINNKENEGTVLFDELNDQEKDDTLNSDEIDDEDIKEEQKVEETSMISANDLVIYYFYDFSIKVPYDWKLDEFESGNLIAEKPEEFHYPSATFIKDGKKILTVNEGGIGSVDAPKEVDCVSSKLGNVCRYSFNGNLIEDEYYISNGDYTIIVNNKSNLSLSDFQTICKTLDVHIPKTGNEYDKYVGDDDLGAINEETNKPLSFNEDKAIGHIKINKDMNIKIRIAPSTSADRVALASKEASFAYYKKEKLGDYTWYCISPDNDMWLADDGSWLKEMN